MTDHTALIEALERAEGPSREWDREIWLSVAADDTSKRAYEAGLAISKDEAIWRAEYMMGGLNYTASIDAALTLVPEGAGIKLDRYWIASVDGPVWMACISTGGVPENPRQTFEAWDCPNAAIALVIAALRAKGAQS